MENLLFLGVPILKHITVCMKDFDGMVDSVNLDQTVPLFAQSYKSH